MREVVIAAIWLAPLFVLVPPRRLENLTGHPLGFARAFTPVRFPGPAYSLVA